MRDLHQTWAVEQKVVRGRFHEQCHMKCQDDTAMRRKSELLSLALADGQGTSEYNSAAVERIVQSINDFMITYAEKLFDMEEDEHTIAENFLIQIRRRIEKMSKQWSVTYQELSSTLLGVCVDWKKKSYCAIHLGDGVIAQREADGTVYILSEPVHGMNRNETVLSTTEGVLNAVKVYRGNWENTTGILLASDGVYKDRFDLPILEKCFSQGVENDILKQNEDDQSVILLRLKERGAQDEAIRYI